MCGFDSDFFFQSLNRKVFQVAGIFGVKCFSIVCGLILVDFKRGDTLMPIDLITLMPHSFLSNLQNECLWGVDNNSIFRSQL